MGKIKYPRTYHVPWSTGTSDDKTHENDDFLKGMDVVVSLKMDGENTSIYHGGEMHARSLERPTHPSQSWVKKLAGEIGWQIPEGMRVCGENLYAKHTVSYSELPSYFMAFSIWKEDTCIYWHDFLAECRRLKICHVPIIYTGAYDKDKIISAFEPFREKHEGYVIRNVYAFDYKDFKYNTAKFVNPNFRQTLKESTVHWASAQVIPNKLKK